MPEHAGGQGALCGDEKGQVKRLTARKIKAGLQSLPGWRYIPGQKAITIEIRMKDFMAAIRAIRNIARLAEKADHHPDLHLTGYRHLKIVLSTHDAGGVTEKDLRLARQIHIIK